MTTSESSLPRGVEVLRAGPEHEPVLLNLLELYSYDFSEFLDLELQPDGRFGYPHLHRYFAEDERFAFLTRVDGRPAGLALVARGSRLSGDPQVWDLTEFFVVRRHRKRGIGAAVAHELWRRFPGRWEVRVLESNRPARAFWPAAIGAFIGARAESVLVEVQGRRWEVFSFVSAGSHGAAAPSGSAP